MKKLGLILLVIGLFFTAAHAQVEELQTEVEVEKELVVAGDEFEKIEVSALPEAVTAAILTQFPEAITTEAFVKQDEEKVIYKVKLDLKGQMKKVYLDSAGNWIKKEDKKEESN
jgi:hypothetical protein